MNTIDCSSAKIKDFEVKLKSIQDVRGFIEYWHYSKSVNGLRISFVFGLYYRDNLIGAAIFGALGMASVWKRYVDKEADILELRRLCCIDKTPKNTESYFIGQCLKYISKNSQCKKNYKLC